MNKKTIGILFILPVIILMTLGIVWKEYKHQTGAPPYGEPETAVPSPPANAYWWNWQRPAGPAKVALQVGHWKNSEFPEELAKLRNNGGASGGGKAEWEVNLRIAEETKKILEASGIHVDILPATIPPKYWSDVFVAIHADGNDNPAVRGYKFAAPWRDLTNKSDDLVTLLNQQYQEITQLPLDPNISRNMRGYYAFAWWKYEHSLHPMTTAVIAETGFLSNPSDRRIIVDQPETSAQAIAQGIIEYLQLKQLMK